MPILFSLRKVHGKASSWRRIKSYHEVILNKVRKEHSICIASYENKYDDIKELTKTTDIASHLKERVNHALILDHPIG